MRTSSRTLVFALIVLVGSGYLAHFLARKGQTLKEIALPFRERSLGLEAAYERWKSEQEQHNRTLVIPLGWSKGLSTEFTTAQGVVTVDLAGGRISVRVDGLFNNEISDVWLVDNREAPGQSVKPETDDVLVQVGRLNHQGRTAALEATPRPDIFNQFQLDLVVVSRTGQGPVEAGVLFGFPSLFQRIYARAWQRRLNFGPSSVVASQGRALPSLLKYLVSTPVYASQSPSDSETSSADLFPDMNALIEKGKRLFFKETFSGNGRTCGTCHPAKNNFTLDPDFIATLPPSDPLFVAEFVPELAENFEKPTLMRQLGLILENVDGFDDLDNKFVMRAVPPTSGLQIQLKALPFGLDGTTIPPRQRTGWGGDGAPGSGTLREFPVGAIVQHFTLSLRREPGIDFRLPNDEELDALEAFQLTLGRQEDLNLLTLKPRAELPAEGRRIFRRLIGLFGTPGKCNACHGNAGARDSVVPGGFTINFNTGVEDLPNQPADLLDPFNPPDGGFGTEPHPEVPGAFGNRTFSTPSIVEAADTGPFFHNNSVNTIEESVDFYNSDAFNNSPSGQLVGGIDLAPEEVRAVAAFLRVLNALENIRLAGALQTRTQSVGEDFDEDLEVATAELEDAVQVLEGAELHPEAVARLRNAIVITQVAIIVTDPEVRRALVKLALSQQEAAREDMVSISLF